MVCLHMKHVHCPIYKFQLLYFHSLEISTCNINHQDNVQKIYLILITYNTQKKSYKNGNNLHLASQ